MSHENDDERSGFSRRTFMQASGTLAGLGVLGAGAAGTAAAHDGFHTEFANPRVWELEQVWEKGYRGRPDRSVGVGDTGCDGRHPDLTWNNVRIVDDGDDIALQQVEVDGDGAEESVGEVGPFTGTLGPGVADAGQVDSATHELDVPDGADEIDVTATWTPQRQDNELILLDGDGNEVASSTDFNPQSGAGERIKAPVEPGYSVRIETYANAASDYEISGTYVSTNVQFTELAKEDFSLPDSADADTPKLVGWKGGTFARDGNGHGSHVSSISAGSGQGSAIDESTVTEESPRTVLLPTDVLSYEVTPEGGNDDSEDNGGVYAAVYGENLELEIEAPDGRTVAETSIDSDSSVSGDVTSVEAYAEQAGTYTVYVRSTDDGLGTSVGRVNRVSAGAFLPPSETTGDRTDGEGSTDTGTPTLHAGAAPNSSLVTIQGLGNALDSFSTHADFYTEQFGLRSANFSYGGLPTERLGLSDTYQFVEEMANGGILTVSSAGNNGPLTGGTGPSGASEAICTAATGSMDGLTAYTSGGTVVRDEDGEVYRKPDLTAPGGTLDDLATAVEAGATESDDPVRGYTGKAGTSMAAPYVNGVAGVVAQAMEEDAPESIALPEPTDTENEDVLRLKQALLATASETAFTAAPYHRAHAPGYDFGGRDPFEGFGRVNPDTAVDAVTRELDGTASETVGLDLQADSRAVAGYVDAPEGTLEASVSFSHYGGGNEGMAKDNPHVDLFVYDAANPADYGEPNIVARAQGLSGDASVSASVESGVYYVVAKLVNVPGAVNGYDVQAHLDLSASVDPLGFTVADGDRETTSSVFTAGQPDIIKLTVEGPSDDAEIRDVIPEEWTVNPKDNDDVDRVEDGEGVQYVYFNTDVAEGDSETVQYVTIAPEGIENTNQYQFGPAEARPADSSEDWVSVPNTSDNRIFVGAQV